MRDRAAYMREYRAKQKAKPMTDHEMAMALTSKPGWTLIADEHLALLMRQIADLETEVAHLKRELAQRPPPPIGARVLVTERRDYAAAMQEFRPVPKPSQRGK